MILQKHKSHFFFSTYLNMVIQDANHFQGNISTSKDDRSLKRPITMQHHCHQQNRNRFSSSSNTFPPPLLAAAVEGGRPLPQTMTGATTTRIRKWYII
jgi:hypothetical protein